MDTILSSVKEEENQNGIDRWNNWEIKEAVLMGLDGTEHILLSGA